MSAAEADVERLASLVERLCSELDVKPSGGVDRHAIRASRDKKKLTLEMVIPIRWGDMDAMGHVNNTIYFRYLEIVRIEWLHRVAGAPDPAGEGPVIVNTFCNFLKQLKYPGDVLASTTSRSRGEAASRRTSRSNGRRARGCSTRRVGRRPCG